MHRGIIAGARAAASWIGLVIIASIGGRPAADILDSNATREADVHVMATAPPVGAALPAVKQRPGRLAHHPEREHDERGHVGGLARTDAQWHAHCRGARTSYNPDRDLRTDSLTLMPDDPRWPGFVFRTLDNSSTNTRSRRLRPVLRARAHRIGPDAA